MMFRKAAALLGLLAAADATNERNAATLRRGGNSNPDEELPSALEGDAFWGRVLQESMSMGENPTTSPVPSQVPSPVPPTERPSPNPSILFVNQNQVLTGIAVIDDVSGDNDFESKWANFRATHPYRNFCLLQPKYSNGRPAKDALDIPPAFDTDDTTTYSGVVRDDEDRENPSDWYEICDLQQERDWGVTHVALWVKPSLIQGPLSAVHSSFSMFQDQLIEKGFAVVTGEVNDNDDWISPFQDAWVSSNQTGIACTENDDCSSHVCVEDTCRDALQGIGEICQEDLDCQNFACAMDATSSATKVCCPSHGRNTDYCLEQPVGAACDSDETCASGVCVEQVCVASPQSIGEACDKDDDSDCDNGACGRESYPDGNFICCATNETRRALNDNFCSGQLAGAQCPFDVLCDSGVCVNGVCQDGAQDVGEPCDPSDNNDCANQACGRESYPGGSHICCASGSVIQDICTNQPTGAGCGSGAHCGSGICVNFICN